MKRFFTLFITIFSLFSGVVYGQQSYKGNLVIVGGGLEADNKSIYQQLIGFAGGADKATFAIIPSAGGVPMQSYVSFRNILISYGVKPDHIHLIPIAVIDDDSTLNVNESEWKNNGNDTTLAELVRKCSAVWFTGGDQLRTTKSLIRPDGSQTPVLKAVWDVYRAGGVLGGTSAGAAIMSEVMIGGGNSLAALNHGVIMDYKGDDFPEDQGVLVTYGLGFFPLGLIDQHFNTRARIARTIVALMNENRGDHLGFGVDENTALIYNGQQNRISVAGASAVTILNSSEAKITYVNNMPVIENLLISYLENGDSWDAQTGIITPAEGKQSMRGAKNHREPYSGQTGVLSGSQDTFRNLLLALQYSNDKESLQNINFTSDTTGFLVKLYKTPLSEGFSFEKPNQGHGYTIAKIRMDITPVHVSVTPINNKY